MIHSETAKEPSSTMRLLAINIVNLLLVCSAVTLTEGLYFLCKDVGDESWKMVPKDQLCGTSCDQKLGDVIASPDPDSVKTLFCPTSNQTSCKQIKDICQKCRSTPDILGNCYQASGDDCDLPQKEWKCTASPRPFCFKCIDETAKCKPTDFSCGTLNQYQCVSTETLKDACAKVTTSPPTTNVSRYTAPMGVMIAFIVITGVMGIVAALASVVPALIR